MHFWSLLFVCLILVSCSPSEQEQKASIISRNNRALPKTVQAPEDNPSSAQKEILGKLLFYDPILSGDKDVACATCHHPQNGYAEFREISIGVNGKGFGSKRVFKQPNTIPFVKRNSQTVLNTAFNGIDVFNHYDPDQAPMFWDIRARSLEEQALEPIKTFEEMRGHNYSEGEILNEVVLRLKANTEYLRRFKTVFGEPAVTAENIGKAIAAFERTLITNNSRFDRYMRGDDQAISLSEKQGFELFKKVGCVDCHSGAMFSDYQAHVLGVPRTHALPAADKGIDSIFAFRTASLRNLRFTAPYMHNGSFRTLLHVLEFYEDISSGKSHNPAVSKEQIDPLARDLELSVKDMRSIISFLNTLNDEGFDKEIPPTVPSGLAVGGSIKNP